MVLKLRNWIPIEKLNGVYLFVNPNAIHLLEANLDKINWNVLSMNPNAIHLLEANPDKINWDYLSRNSNAIHLLEANLDKIDWNRLSENPNAIHLLEANPDKIDWEGLSMNPNAMHLLDANRDKIDWSMLSINPSIFIDEPIEEHIEESIDKLIEDPIETNVDEHIDEPIEEFKIEEPSSKDIEPTTMTTHFGFGAYCKHLTLSYYSKKTDKDMYISKETVDKIVSCIDTIIDTINERKNSTNSQMIKRFMDTQLEMANAFKNLQQSYSYEHDVLTEELDLIKTAKLCGLEGIINYGSFHIYTNKELDYLTHKEELRELLKNRKEDEPQEETSEVEDASILDERRKLILTLEHPDGYVDEDGSYNYEEIECKLSDELKQAAMMYRLRYKARKHFEDMDKQEYDYAGMKKNKQQLHGELKAAMRLLKKYMDVPMALKSKE